MPRLVKGGKFVYGLTEVSTTGTVVIPPQAMEEYEYHDGDTVIVMSGSRTSGGFGLAKPDKLVNSHLDVVLKNLPELPDASIPEARPVSDRGRLFCTTTIKQDGCIQLPPEILSEYGIQPGDMLAAARGSHLAIGFIARGPIMNEALKHPELEIFGVLSE
jgi:bifunctional DNA-binding transcriptional regulator/antitoxin component of YhaV-PrlF toxin-antitoxin module